MKRALLTLSMTTLIASVFLLPARASADLFGAYVQGHGGYQMTNRTGHPAFGAAAGLTLLGLETFADLRFLRDGFSEDRGMWNQIGLRFGLGLPIPKIDLEFYGGVSYVFSKVASEDQDPQDMDNEADGWKGLNPHLGGRLDVPLFPLASLGLQVEVGFHYLFPNDLTYSSGTNLAVLGAFKLSI